MTTLSASEARAKLFKLLDEAASSHEPNVDSLRVKRTAAMTGSQTAFMDKH